MRIRELETRVLELEAQCADLQRDAGRHAAHARRLEYALEGVHVGWATIHAALQGSGTTPSSAAMDRAAGALPTPPRVPASVHISVRDAPTTRVPIALATPLAALGIDEASESSAEEHGLRKAQRSEDPSGAAVPTAPSDASDAAPEAPAPGDAAASSPAAPDAQHGTAAAAAAPWLGDVCPASVTRRRRSRRPSGIVSSERLASPRASPRAASRAVPRTVPPSPKAAAQPASPSPRTAPPPPSPARRSSRHGAVATDVHGGDEAPAPQELAPAPSPGQAPADVAPSPKNVASSSEDVASPLEDVAPSPEDVAPPPEDVTPPTPPKDAAPPAARTPSRRPRASRAAPPVVPPSPLDDLPDRTRRARKSVNYALPKLNTKMRKPDPDTPDDAPPAKRRATAERRRSRAPTAPATRDASTSMERDAEPSGVDSVGMVQPQAELAAPATDAVASAEHEARAAAPPAPPAHPPQHAASHATPPKDTARPAAKALPRRRRIHSTDAPGTSAPSAASASLDMAEPVPADTAEPALANTAEPALANTAEPASSATAAPRAERADAPASPTAPASPPARRRAAPLASLRDRELNASAMLPAAHMPSWAAPLLHLASPEPPKAEARRAPRGQENAVDRLASPMPRRRTPSATASRMRRRP